MTDEILNSIEESLKKNISDFQKERRQKQRLESAEQAKRAEEYFFAKKVTDPAEVKNIFRLKPEMDLEEKIIEEFIEPHADPTCYTIAMEGRPFVALVSMDNGMKYRAAMTRLIYIEWPKGAQQMSSEKQKLLIDQKMKSPNNPTILGDEIKYALLLWPVHKGGRIDEKDSIDVRWNITDDIVTLQEKEGKDAGDGIHTVGGVCLGGTGLCTGSFYLLNAPRWGFRTQYPRHFHRLFGKIQKAYDRAREQGTLGKTIYSVFDPTKPPRGIGWTYPNLLSFKRIFFDIPAIKIKNPNQPLRIIHKKPVPLPRRITIDKPAQLEHVNTHD